MASPPIALLAALHLVYFGGIKPWLTWRGRHVWPATPPERVRRYRALVSDFLQYGVFSLVTLFYLAWRSPRAPRVTHIYVLGRLAERPRDVWLGLFPAEWPGAGSIALGVVAFLVMVAIDLAYSRRCFDRGEPHMHLATPQTRAERSWWVVVSFGAGVTEELTWRGVQPEIIAQMTGALWPAVLVCAATFGIGHVRQGRPFVLIAALFALVFHALTLVTGSLYVAMAVHAAVNITVGLRGGRWVRRPA